MKTKVEINGYEISIEEMGGNITVKALKDGESVEEFTLGSGMEETGTEPTGDETQIKGFSEFGDEEHDFQSPEDETESEMSDVEPHAFGEGEEPDYAESENEEPDYAGAEDEEMESEDEDMETNSEDDEDEDEDEDEMESEDEDEEEMESEEDEDEEEMESEEEEEESPSEPEVKESLKTFESFIKFSKKPTRLKRK